MDKRKIILDSALRLFSRFGYEKTTINDISTEAGIGKGTIYYYFATKEDIYISLLKKEINLFKNKINKILNEDISSQKKYIRMVNAPLDFLIDECELIKQRWSKNISFNDKKIMEKKQEMLEIIKGGIVESLKLLKKDDLLSIECNIEEIGELIIRLIYDMRIKDLWFNKKSFEKIREGLYKVSYLLLVGLLKRGENEEDIN